MKYCDKCGKELVDEAVMCTRCGIYLQPKKEVVKEEHLIFYGLISLLIPVVGIVIFLVWNDTKPKTARIAMICGLISLLLWIVLFIFIFVGMFVMMNRNRIYEYEYYYDTSFALINYVKYFL